jgi:septal ring factor EnvC (AmiA/AmiB activator)
MIKNITILTLFLALLFILGSKYLYKVDNRNLTAQRNELRDQIDSLEDYLQIIDLERQALEQLNENLAKTIKDLHKEANKKRRDYANIINDISDMDAVQSAELFGRNTD